MLTDGRRITAVLDWEEAKYGDPLLDIATAYFWRTCLDCMEAFVTYCQPRLQTLPNYHERITCYQVHLGLQEIYSNTIAADEVMLEWSQQRSREILDMTQNPFC